MPDQPVFRFAPSPNGELHLGHAFSALFTAQAAAQAGGRFLLRIEDIDQTRARADYETQIYKDLAWLGLHWEEPVRRQSQHFADYQRALDTLMSAELIYPCFATRAQIATASLAKDPDGAPLYSGLWRDAPAAQVADQMAAGTPYALRLNMARALQLAPADLVFKEELQGPGGEHGLVRATPAIWGDVIIARKDVPTSYHLAVVVDDALQGITHVTRGQDLFYATHIHRVLQALLDLPTPRYRHHRLICDETGRKLSKSVRDTSLRALRDGGATPADICRMVGFEAQGTVR